MIFSCNTSSLLQYGGGSEIKGCDLFGSFIQKCFVWSFVRSTFLNAWSMYREGLEQGASYSCFDYIKRPIYMHTILQQGLASCFNVSVLSCIKMETRGFFKHGIKMIMSLDLIHKENNEIDWLKQYSQIYLITLALHIQKWKWTCFHRTKHTS